jgi:hypothetical protein
MLTRYDELPHPAQNDPHWRESWYLNFFDHEQELYGIAWMGIRPPRGLGESLFAIGQGPRFLLRHEDFRIAIAPAIGRERTRFGPLTFRVLQPYRRWAVEFHDDDADVELEWTATAAVYNWEWQDSARSWHYQHPGRVRGTIRVGGHRFNFDGHGERDRAWGRRDNNYFRAVHWTTAQFPSGTTFEAMHVALPGRDDLYGYAHRDGESSLLSSLDLEPRYAFPGGPPTSATICARDRTGREFVLEQQIMNMVSMGQVTRGVEARQYFTFNRYTLDGQTGYGMMDHWWSTMDALKGRYLGAEPNRGRLFSLENFEQP